MAYYLNLFTPETWMAFREHGATISGFRERQRRTAKEDVKPEDILLCYVVRVSRWCGALEVLSDAFEDGTPIFNDPDPFVIRFHVKPLALLDLPTAIPIFEDSVWKTLSETRDVEKRARGWAGAYFRRSLRRMDDADGEFLLKLLQRQAREKVAYPLTERDKRQLSRKFTVRTLEGEVAVEVPDYEDDEEEAATETADVGAPAEVRQSIQVQAAVAQIGAKMGFRIWIPRSDRGRVLEHVASDFHDAFLNTLPLNYDDTTLKTIEQIDVLWLKGRSMARAFEIEHTTAIYSGLLRMADLLALQPNMDIHLHIVAPSEKREKVLREIKRPVFSLLDQGPLYKKCTFLAYESVTSLSQTPHLGHMSDTILEEYEESAED